MKAVTSSYSLRGRLQSKVLVSEEQRWIIGGIVGVLTGGAMIGTSAIYLPFIFAGGLFISFMANYYFSMGKLIKEVRMTDAMTLAFNGFDVIIKYKDTTSTYDARDLQDVTYDAENRQLKFGIKSNEKVCYILEVPEDVEHKLMADISRLLGREDLLNEVSREGV